MARTLVSVRVFSPSSLLHENDKNANNVDNDLSISKISVHGGSSCVFYGVDGSVTSVGNGKTVDVGPPQTQTRGHCT